MKYRCLFALVVVNFVLPAAAANRPLPEPVATLNMPELRRGCEGDFRLATVAFISDQSIAVKVRRSSGDGKCAFALLRWESSSPTKVGEIEQVSRDLSHASADRKRVLVDTDRHQAHGVEHLLNTLQIVLSLGMMGPEDVNREIVLVGDSVTRKSCFEWQRSFPATYATPRSADISPSGEFVAIAADGKLSLYRLPAVCEGRKVKLVCEGVDGWKCPPVGQSTR